ncbi:MAG: DUF6116 family protein [Thermoanaerobaculia bacterium]|nr:DUF6116 family protein [Thermoanaerobaculia bacterium]
MFKTPLVGWLLRYASRLRHPHLFLLFLSLFVLDLVVPDMVPFADEFLLGLLSLLLGTWGDRRRGAEDAPSKPPEKNVTPEGEG